MYPYKDDFQVVKALVVGGALFCFMAAQFIWPYQRQFSKVFKNWLCNIPLGATNGLINGILTTLLIVPIAYRFGRWGFGQEWVSDTSHWIMALVSVFVLDLTAYIWHRANHKWGFLWRFHAVHHSDRVFDASTALRFHPGEVLISTAVRLMVVLLLGLPWTGVLGFEMIFTVFNFFEHTNLRLPAWLDRGLSLVIVTPAFHRLHHSIDLGDQNKNFATIFSVWDRLGGSLSWSKDIIAVGLSPEDQKNRSFWELIVMPFTKRKD